MTAVEQALRVLQDALKRAKELDAPTYSDPEWGMWYRRADQRTIYESAIELAIEALEGRRCEDEG